MPGSILLQREIKKCFDKTNPVANYAFSLFLFCFRLYSECKKTNITDVFFFSREGQFLKILFDEYLDYYKLSIETHYLYVSRNSTTLPSFDFENDDLYSFFKNKGYNSITLRKVISALSIQEERIINLLGNNDLDNEICAEELKDILSNRAIKDLLLFESERAKVNFNNYLKLSGYTGERNQCIVDVGWQGTIQDNLSASMGVDKTIGFYLGTTRFKTKQSNIKRGLLFDENRASNCGDSVFKYRYFDFETVLLADHGKTIGYEENGAPIIKADSDVEAYKQYVCFWREKIYTIFCRLLEILNNQDSILAAEKVFIKMHKRYYLTCFKLFLPEYKSALALHKDSFMQNSYNFNGFYIWLSSLKRRIKLFLSH